MRSKSRPATLLAGLVTLSVVALAGCSSSTTPDASSSSAAPDKASIDEAMNTPTTLTYWSWVSDLDKEVALFEKKYPKIKIDVQNVGQGAAAYQKLRTALKSGEGAPDLAQIEFQYLSSFTLTKSLADLAPLGADEMKGDFPEWIWKQVSINNGVYAVPQDSGPMGNLYRSDILAKAGITDAPTTWDQYAADAATVKEKTGSYISNLAANEPGAFVGLLWQAGVKPFGYDGEKTVSISVNGSDSQKVYAYWQGLIQKDLISTDADFADSWYQGLAKGKYAGWLGAAWGPMFLQGTVADTSGKWSAAPLPQWSAGENASGNWGGSTTAVMATSQHAIAAYEFAKFLNTDPTSAMMLNTQQSLFPVTNAVLKDSAFTGAKSAFFNNQEVNKTFSDISPTINTDFEWLPFMDYVYSSFNETVGKAMTAKGDLSAAADTWQKDLETYAKQQGFTVK
ncbi:ABC transporter substrate-binding protein [Microbacterium gorillae]|uniref:ABC transporter substrate-binding protein n=1 Tax=Microbacterium gorillae TaxID=1231063 RepID=UPI0006950756|nr:extracellular solute-binding protein [Microbacterium gorillae]